MTTYTRFINGEFETTLYDSENLRQCGINIDSSYVKVEISEPPKFSIYKKIVGYHFIPWEDFALQIWDEEEESREEILGEIDAGQRPYKLIENEISKAVQKRLDKFAQDRGYDDILSCCSYSTSGVEKFRLEAELCISKRDETWAAVDSKFSEAESGQIERIVFFSDIEETLPTLSWD